MQAQPCFCAGVLRCGRDFGFDTGPSWRAVAHAPGPHGSAAVREPSIPFTRALRVFVALEACDMRKGFDGLSGLARAGDKSICRAASQFPNILKLQTLGTIDYFEERGGGFSERRSLISESETHSLTTIWGSPTFIFGRGWV